MSFWNSIRKASLINGIHYHQNLEDGSCVGLFDGTRSGGAISEKRFWQYHEEVARRVHPAVRGHVFAMRQDQWPGSAIQHARVRTALISTYRVHSRRYFAGGERFPESWPSKDLKAGIVERYSPPGTIGYYFGLTVDAALDEARYYDPAIDLTQNESKILLVHRTYYHDLLYLTPVLPAVWTELGFPEMNTWDMYLTIMDPRTGNDITDRIGLWAREEGFKGIVYPSARYGQRVDWTDDTGPAAFPALNFVEIGSHLCEQGIAMHMTLNELARTLTRITINEPPPIVFSEPNLVVFDEDAVAGGDRPVFYQTYELHESEFLKSLDERKGLKTQMKLAYDEKKIVVYVDHAEYMFRAEAPREVGPEEPVVFSIHNSKTPEMQMVEVRGDIDMKWRPKESKIIANAKVNLGEGKWRDATARHMEGNLYALFLPIDPAMPVQWSSPAIVIEGAQATYVPSETMTVTTKGELVLMATLKPN